MNTALKAHASNPHRLVRCERHVDWNRHGGVCGRTAATVGADGIGLCHFHLPEFSRLQAQRSSH